MMRTTWALALLLIIAACGDSAVPTMLPAATTVTTTPTTTPTTTSPTTTVESMASTVLEAVYEGGVVTTAEDRYEVDVGDMVEIRVTSDVAEEVHVHGYDYSAGVAAGGTVVISFLADIPGIFEVELEDSHLGLFEIEVS